METLDKVIDMQRQSVPDAEIARRLQNEGISPKEIYNALNQARIKSAVMAPDQNQNTMSMDMQPSILSPQDIPQQQASTQESQMTPQMYPSESQYQQQYQQPAQEYYPQTPQAYPQEYSAQNYAQPSGFDTEAVSEVAEQVASEKINEFKKSIGDINMFKTLVQDKLSELDDRVRRIESSIDKIHHAVIGKIGEFGENSSMIHRDLENLHGTVSKLMNPLVDNYNELKKLNDKK